MSETPDTRIDCLWTTPNVTKRYQAAVSLHSHTSQSKESLAFIPEFSQRWPILRWALQRQYQRSRVPVDLTKAHWTPPLTPKLALDVERDQVQNILGLAGLIALTDHDNIEAATLLRRTEPPLSVPFSLEWTVPFGNAIFHLGIHNLPTACAHEVVADFRTYTKEPSSTRVVEILAMLNQLPDVLVIFNHPLWDLCSLGRLDYGQVLNQFLRENIRFLHAFEVNATRGWKENHAVIQLANRWGRVIVSGGDRHGREPSGALNLTRAKSFSEFVHEVRREQRSHVLFMPQYAESRWKRTLQTLIDVIREYPEYPAGSQRWDGRVFHPDPITGIDGPVAAYWNTPPVFLERIFSVIRLLGNTAGPHLSNSALREDGALPQSPDIFYETTS